MADTGSNTTLYVPKPDQPLWDAARRYAKSRNTSLYRVVAAALADYLPRAAAEPDPADRWAAIAADNAA